MLWTFGCSHTAGHGLPDCAELEEASGKFLPISNSTSKLGWCATLAELMNEPLTNRGVGGVGVKVAWHRAVTAPVQPNDTVVVMWPCWESRIDIMDDPNNVTHPDAVHHDAGSIAVRTWRDDQTDFFDKYYTLYDQWIMWHLHMTHLHYHFNVLRKKDNIRLIQTHWQKYTGISPIGDSWPAPDFSNFEFTRCFFGHYLYRSMPRALDGNHNGIKANTLFAQELYAEMQLSH